MDLTKKELLETGNSTHATCSSNSNNSSSNTKDQHMATTTSAGSQALDATYQTNQCQVMPHEAEVQLPQRRVVGEDAAATAAAATPAMTAAAAAAAAAPDAPTTAVTAADQAADGATADKPVADFFDRVPGSWLHQFIKGLPRESQLALFACTKGLCKHVVSTAEGVTLRLHNSKELTPEQTRVRRQAITCILSVRKSFAVDMKPRAWQPFPTQLAARLSSITAQYCATLPVSPAQDWDGVASCCPWVEMTNLQKVHLDNSRECSINDLCRLCEAAEAGHLRQLCTLTVHACTPGVAERLARAVGQRLEELESGCMVLVRQVSQLQVLHRLTVWHGWKLDNSIMQQLCEHPTLQHLALRGQCDVLGDHSKRKCRWDTVTLEHMHLEDILFLPLASVKRICVVGCVDNAPHDRNTEPLVAMQSLDQHTHKMVCSPSGVDYPLFTLNNPSEAMAPFVKCMQGVERLELSLIEGDKAHMLACLWHALPLCIGTVGFSDSCGFDWAQVWAGLPQHVVRMLFWEVDATASQMCEVIRTAPSHVTSIKLTPNSEEIKYTPEDIASLHAAAPKHLQLTVRLY